MALKARTQDRLPKVITEKFLSSFSSLQSPLFSSAPISVSLSSESHMRSFNRLLFWFDNVFLKYNIANLEACDEGPQSQNEYSGSCKDTLLIEIRVLTGAPWYIVDGNHSPYRWSAPTIPEDVCISPKCRAYKLSVCSVYFSVQHLIISGVLAWSSGAEAVILWLLSFCVYFLRGSGARGVNIFMFLQKTELKH